jgi:hypothetical protein
MTQGAVTSDNTSDVDAVIDILNQVVATEIVCWMRCPGLLVAFP